MPAKDFGAFGDPLEDVDVMRWWPATVVVAALLVGPAGAAGGQSAEDAHGAAVVFSERGQTPRRVYLVSGSGERRVLSGGVDAIQPAWSPDGERLAFAGNFGASGEEGLFFVELDGDEEARRLTTGRTLYPAWSPDGQRLAYSGPGGHLYAVEAAGGAPWQVTRARPGGFVADAYPSWSPDGSRLVFARLREGDGVGDEIRSVPAAGGHERVIVSGGTLPAWSPVGDLIAFSGTGLEVVRPDGSDRRRLLDGAQFGAAWSPDGQRLVAGVGEDVVIADVDGGSTRTLLADTGGEVIEPTWSGDGRWIAFSAGDVQRVAVDDGSTERLSSSGTAREPVAWPGRAVRVAGPTRVQTAVAVSQQLRARAETIVLASAGDYPDGLAGSALAASIDAPVLLTGGHGLHADAAREIRRLDARRVVLLGGEAALDRQVADDLAAMGLAVERVSGSNRFATAAAIATRLNASRAYLVLGASTDPASGWPDAMAVSGLAAVQGRPILLTLSDRVPVETLAAVDDSGFTHITIIGGEAAVDASVVGSLEARGVTVNRIAGPTRYATSLEVARHATQLTTGDPSTVWLATGRNWPDSLAAGPAVGATNGVLLLVDGRSPEATPATYDWLSGRIGTVRAVGGPDVLDAATLLSVNRLHSDSPAISK